MCDVGQVLHTEGATSGTHHDFAILKHPVHHFCHPELLQFDSRLVDCWLEEWAAMNRKDGERLDKLSAPKILLWRRTRPGGWCGR